MSVNPCGRVCREAAREKADVEQALAVFTSSSRETVDDNPAMSKFPLMARSQHRLIGTVPALVAGLLWGLVTVCTGYWMLQWWGYGPRVSVPAVAGDTVQVEPAVVARALGDSGTTASAGSFAPGARYRLLGIVSRRGQQGTALISVNGQPPRPVLVGAVVDGSVRLLAVERDRVRLGGGDPAATSVELRLPRAPG